MSCVSYCSHGGICVYERDHDGDHSSTYCTWSDADALTRAEADAVLSTKPEGAGVVALWDALEILEDR